MNGQAQAKLTIVTAGRQCAVKPECHPAGVRVQLGQHFRALQTEDRREALLDAGGQAMGDMADQLLDS